MIIPIFNIPSFFLFFDLFLMSIFAIVICLITGQKNVNHIFLLTEPNHSDRKQSYRRGKVWDLMNWQNT